MSAIYTREAPPSAQSSLPHGTTLSPKPLSQLSSSQANILSARSSRSSLRNTSSKNSNSPQLGHRFHVFPDSTPAEQGDSIAEPSAKDGTNPFIDYGVFPPPAQTENRKASAPAYDAIQSVDYAEYVDTEWPLFPSIEAAGSELRNEFRIQDDVSSFRLPTSDGPVPPTRSSYSLFPSTRNSNPPRLSLSPSGHARSRSSASSALYPSHGNDIALIGATGPTERPRSISSPVIPRDEFVFDFDQRIMETQPQAAQQGPPSKPSAMTTARAIYPAPPRLQRKRRTSQLDKAAASARPPPNPRTSSSTSISRSVPRSLPGMALSISSGPRYGSVSPVLEEWQPSSGWRQFGGQPERPGSIAGDLRSLVPASQDLDSRPGSSSSSRSGRTLNRFLSDAYTSWATIYYGGNGDLRPETPPTFTPSSRQGTVASRTQSKRSSKLSQSSLPRPSYSSEIGAVPEMVQIPPLPRHPRIFLRPGTTESTAPSRAPSKFSQTSDNSELPEVLRVARGPPLIVHNPYPVMSEHPSHSRDSGSQPSWSSRSPGSAGFPDTVYVPRIRPIGQQAPDTDSLVSEQQDEVTALPHFGDHLNVTAENPNSCPHSRLHDSPLDSFVDILPALPTDHRVGDQVLPEWRPPSYDEGNGIFSMVNRQIALFAVGFIMPLAWIVAAFLRIPPRPEMRMLGSEDYFNATPTQTDLFDRLAVRRYQKARRWRVTNRIMSVLGICIIAVIGACVGVAAG